MPTQSIEQLTRDRDVIGDSKVWECQDGMYGASVVHNGVGAIAIDPARRR